MDRNIIIAPGFNLPPYWLQSHYKALSHYPVTFVRKGHVFYFPMEPFISVSFKNIITRRTISKGTKRGTVKERWTEDDAEITFSGVFINAYNQFPDEVQKLQEFFNAREAIEVHCELLNGMDINKIVIESLDFPHTKGADTQQFEIKAYSDDVFQLLIEN